jgi:hypothetical protein
VHGADAFGDGSARLQSVDVHSVALAGLPARQAGHHNLRSPNAERIENMENPSHV